MNPKGVNSPLGRFAGGLPKSLQTRRKSLARHREAGPGSARLGAAGPGKTWPGKSRRGLVGTGETGPGTAGARHGSPRRGPARPRYIAAGPGPAWRFTAKARLGAGRSWLRPGPARPGEAGRGAERRGMATALTHSVRLSRRAQPERSGVR